MRLRTLEVRLLAALPLAPIAAALCCYAQNTVASGGAGGLEIRVFVLEQGVVAPLSGAEVQFWKAAQPGERSVNGIAAGAKGPLRTEATDSDGSCRFTPDQFGSYLVIVRKEGYVPAPGLATSAVVIVTKEHPVREARLVLSRPGAITARLVDAEDGKPIAGLQVSVLGLFYLNGVRAPDIRAGTSITNADGEIFARAPIPEDYVVVVRPRIERKALTQFAPKDLDAVDLDYPETYWPGGHDLDSASPIAVGSNGQANFGRLAVHKQPHYRVHGWFPAGDCRPGETVELAVKNPHVPWTDMEFLGPVPCAGDFLLRGFAPGSYRVDASVTGRKLEDRVRGSVILHVVDRNIAASIPLERGIDVEGVVVAAAGAGRPPFDDITIGASAPEGGSVFQPDENAPFKVDAEGRFRIVNIAARDRRLTVSGLGERYYLKEKRYGGLAVAGDVVPFSRGAATQSLVIVVDDKPAALAGAVRAHGDPVAKTRVLLARWPRPPLTLRKFDASAAGDDNGNFHFGPLIPGEYRVVAIRAAVEDKLNEPHVLEGLLEGAKQITLESGRFQQLALDLTELR